MALRSMKRMALAAAVTSLAGAVVLSCSGTPRSPAAAIEKMVKSHGGVAAAERLGSFVGRGFIRDLSDTVVVKSNAFDVYRSGNRYKHVVSIAPSGTLTGLIVISHDGPTTVEWTSRTGLRVVPEIEIGMLPYRFPAVIAWAKEHERSGAFVPGTGKSDADLRIAFPLGDSLLTISIDRKTSLLAGVEVAGAADSVPTYSESYDTYMDLDGAPFPSRFTGRYRNITYYEYLLSIVELRADMPDSLFRINPSDTAAFVAAKAAAAAAAPGK